MDSENPYKFGPWHEGQPVYTRVKDAGFVDSLLRGSVFSFGANAQPPSFGTMGYFNSITNAENIFSTIVPSASNPVALDNAQALRQGGADEAILEADEHTVQTDDPAP